MTFDPAQHNRASDGRFTEKTGTAAEVSLGPTPPTRRELRAVTDVFVLPRGGVRKDERLTTSDMTRIRDYLDRHDIVFAEKGKKKSSLDADAAEDGAYGTADQALADLIIAARNHEKDNRFNEEEYATARELFGDEYQAIVNPKRTFWEQVRGF